MATEAFITPSMLRWARERDQLSADRASQHLHVKAEQLQAWEAGLARPTLRQAQSLAQRLNIPFGFLFLTSPPSEELPLPDLRTVSNGRAQPASPELLDILSDVLAKQEWYREYLEQEGAEPAAFVGRFTPDDNADDIARDIRDTLDINKDLRDQARSRDEFLRIFVAQIEAAGTLVLRSGIVGNAAHRKLSVNEFRGFAISDYIAPLIFVNGRDSKSAQIFTLAHELSHLWIGQSGISDAALQPIAGKHSSSIERLCNRAASSLLLPSEEFLPLWQKSNDLHGNLDTITRRFKVSSAAALIRAYELNLVTWESYWATYNELTNHVQGGSETGGGGNFYATLFARNSRTLTAALISALSEGRVLHRDVARMLHVKVETIARIAANL